MKPKKIILTVCALIFVLPFAIRAQHQSQNSVFSNGGAGTGNSSFRIAGTAGQPLTGVTGNQSITAQSGYWAQTIDLITSVEQIVTESIPGEFLLHQNYPNPFNPATTIQFALPERSAVTLKLFNVLGKEIATLLDEELQPGDYKVNFDAEGLPSGIYFYRIHAKSPSTGSPKKPGQAGQAFTRTRKLMLLK